MARELEIKIGADVKSAIRGLDTLEDSIDDIIKHLDRLADEGDGTAAALARDMRQAATKVEAAGKDMSRGLSKAFDQAKDEAGQSGREAAASFSGGFDDVGDFVQETLANALGGFGPAGAAAGVVFAAAFGAALQGLADQQERLEQAREAAADLASTLYENKGELPVTEQVDRLIQMLTQERAARGLESLIDGFADLGTNLDVVKQAAKITGTNTRDLYRILGGVDAAGARDALRGVNEDLDALYAKRQQDSHGLFPDIQPLESLRTLLEGVVTQAEIADSALGAVGASYESQAYVEKVNAIQSAWDEATTSLGDYITEQEQGPPTFDAAAWIAAVEAEASAVHQVQAKLLTLPPEIQNLVNTAWAENGASAANAVADAYVKSTREQQGKMRTAAKTSGEDVGKTAAAAAESAAQAKAQGWALPPIKVKATVDDTAVRNYVPPRKQAYIDYKARQVV